MSSEDLESSFESQLIDLDAVPLSVLRRLDNGALRLAVRHAVEQAGCPSKTETSCSSAHGID